MPGASVTIHDDSPHFSAVLALLGGTALSSPAPALAPPAPVAAPPMPSTSSDADDDGPANPSAPAVDSTGLPWDERIHAKTKATVADGSWRKKRGVDEATVAAVEAELRARSGAPAQPAPVTPPPPPVAQPAPVPMPPMPAVPTAPAPVAQPVPAPVPMPAPVQAPAPVAQPAPPAPLPTADAFSTFMIELSSKTGNRDTQGAPLLHADYLATVATRTGDAFQTPMQAITDFATHPRSAEVIAWATQLMQSEGRWI